MEPIWERGKGTSLNSDSLAPKPLASSFYVRVPEAPSPHERSISVTFLFPSPSLFPSLRSPEWAWFGLSAWPLGPIAEGAKFYWSSISRQLREKGLVSWNG